MTSQVQQAETEQQPHLHNMTFLLHLMIFLDLLELSQEDKCALECPLTTVL